MKAFPLVAVALIALAQYSEAQPPNVLAHWKFDPADPSNDSSGNGHTLTLRGADTHFVSDPRFGGALQIEDKNESGKEKPQGAVAIEAKLLSPTGAFTIDLWLQIDPGMEVNHRATLVDKKYYYAGQNDPRASQGYMLILRKLSNGEFQLEADLGLGTTASTIRSSQVALPSEEWGHFVFTYDGVSTGKFYFNDKPAGEQTLETGGPVAPNDLAVVIGDRKGQNHLRFLGKITDIKIIEGIATTP